MKVFRSVPSQRGYNQPCPLWHGQCTIYTSPDYPHFCSTYKCKLLKKVLDETTSLPEALGAVSQAKGMIHELEGLLPDSPNPNFRERLVARLKSLEGQEDLEFRRKAGELLTFYERVFGVDDLIETPPDA